MCKEFLTRLVCSGLVSCRSSVIPKCGVVTSHTVWIRTVLLKVLGLIKPNSDSYRKEIKILLQLNNVDHYPHLMPPAQSSFILLQVGGRWLMVGLHGLKGPFQSMVP